MALTLASPIEEKGSDSLAPSITAVNKHASRESYAAVVARTKVNPKNDERNAWIRRDWEGKPKNTRRQKNIHESTRLLHRPFKTTAKKTQNVEDVLQDPNDDKVLKLQKPDCGAKTLKHQTPTVLLIDRPRENAAINSKHPGSYIWGREQTYHRRSFKQVFRL